MTIVILIIGIIATLITGVFFLYLRSISMIDIVPPTNAADVLKAPPGPPGRRYTSPGVDMTGPTATSPTKDLTGCLGGILIGGIVITAGLSLSYFIGWSTIQNYNESEDWPQYPGTVLSSDLTESTDSEGDTTLSIEINYEYRVDGDQYESNRLFFGYIQDFNFVSNGDAREWADTYQAGDEIEVYVNPDDPEDSYLERRLGTVPYIALIVGGVIALIGGGIILSRFRKLVA